MALYLENENVYKLPNRHIYSPCLRVTWPNYWGNRSRSRSFGHI